MIFLDFGGIEELMKNKLLVFSCFIMTLFYCNPVYAVTTEDMASGTGTIVKIGIVILLAFLILLTLIFAYGMIRNLIKTRKKD
jgi:hypothetical protein